ncbi:Acyl-CoA N-acyltransferase [Penicillium griseofulvum]|uniref:Acyl-CoA N-acyltransferase n=1 Tax=Penicillium patulum TaxID=5078 RepID=A0A135LII6_PENPA|nr:Acyl-CoA N-acyltransferase [Penicillium griseofulvum]KXG48764.1 Acyl-CoA N-acyltransferase [Penicillium griseofulvum]
MGSNLKVTLFPWDPDSEVHVRCLVSQRVECSWHYEEVEKKWKKQQLNGEKCIYWINDEMLQDTATTINGVPREPTKENFVPIGHISLDSKNPDAEHIDFDLPAENIFWIKSFYVRKTIQGQGIGRATMDEVEAMAAREPLLAKILLLDTVQKDDQKREEFANVTYGGIPKTTNEECASSPGSGSLGNGRFFAPLEPPSALPGYLGSTSYSAVLTEHRSDISFEPEETTDSSAGLAVEPDRLQSGVDVLRFLYNLTVCDMLVARYYVRTLNIIVPKMVMDEILRSVHQIFDGFSSDPTAQLQELANQIFQNTSRPMRTHKSMSVEEYCSSFTGRNLRWEALGSIFTLCGMQLVITPDNDPDVTQGSDDPRAKDQLLEQITVISTVCLGFCDQTSSANELLAMLQYHDAMLRTQQYGDSSYQAWRRLGDLVSTIYAAGLHLETSGTEGYPLFLRQWRRRCFVAAFYMDKMIATFVGRPPLINGRFCTLSAPLDLTDEVLIAGGDVLSKAISELDSAGWNTEGKLHVVTPTRLRFQLAIIREETLEVVLGTHEQRNLIQKSEEIQAKSRAIWESTPDQLRYDRRPNDHSYDGWLTIVYFYLDYLMTCFLLYRAVVKHTNTGQADLCDVSRRILAIVIQIHSFRTPMVDLDRHFSWIVLTYGVPSASVLLLELLRQSHEPGPHTVPLPRAELIRNLSVFISFLSWVAGPGHGNYHTCKQAEKKLSRILDQLLDPEPVQQHVVDDVTTGLDNFLNWSNYNTIWDFNTDYMPLTEGFAP